jgi:hypothetical protein
MESAFPSGCGWLAVTVLGAVLLAGGVGCNSEPPATKTPGSKDSGGEREQIPNPPKRDPG